MKISKVLVTSLLLAPFAFVAGAEGAACNDGGGYVQLNGGVSIGRVKIDSRGRKGTKAQTKKLTGMSKAATAAGTAAAAAAAAGTAAAAFNTAYNTTASTYALMYKGKNASTKKTKGQPTFELLFGYDWRLNDVRFGVDLGMGTRLGKNKQYYQGNNLISKYVAPFANYITVKNLWYGLLKLNVGYHFTPVLIGYVTIGLEAHQTKVSSSSVDTHKWCKNLKKDTAKKVRFNPTVGAKLVWQIDDSWYSALAYDWHLRSNLKVPKKMGKKANNNPTDLVKGNINKIKAQYHSITLGVGYRF
ncbi:MAG: hypothetical protein LBM19_01270 [Holosporales bacterium]|jgi:opacity protein-like surface antigen|nr:hypothetical protein [Holosporales bacterium]